MTLQFLIIITEATVYETVCPKHMLVSKGILMCEKKGTFYRKCQVYVRFGPYLSPIFSILEFAFLIPISLVSYF